MATLVENSRILTYPHESWENMRSALMTKQVSLDTQPNPAAVEKSEKVCQTTQTEPELQRAQISDNLFTDQNQNLQSQFQPHYFQVRLFRIPSVECRDKS